MREKVLILDAQQVQTLAIAKQLKKNGYYVILFCDNKFSYGYRTRYADEKILCPSITEKADEFSLFVQHYLQQHHIDVLIPMTDYSATYLSENKKLLSQYTRFIIPDKDVFYRGYDKKQLMYFCLEHHFPCPATIEANLENIEIASESIGFPLLIKPDITTGGRGITLIASMDELKKMLPLITEEHGSCHLQEFIPAGGRQLKVQLFIDINKNVKYSTVIHKIRFYPENGGSSCCNVTIEENSLVQMCGNVLKQIGWIGFADFDLIEDPRNGIIKIMEINPRVPACIKSSIISGIDFATIIVDATLNKPLKTYTYQAGKYLRYFGLDILWFLYSPKRFKTKPNWFAFWGRDIFYQEGSLDDWRPFLFGTVGGFLKQLNPQFRKAKAGMRNL